MHFGVRSDTIDHYRKRHAMNYIYCSKCDKPITTHNLIDFNEHYRKVHPKEPLPNDLDASMNRSGMDSAQIENVYAFITVFSSHFISQTQITLISIG